MPVVSDSTISSYSDSPSSPELASSKLADSAFASYALSLFSSLSELDWSEELAEPELELTLELDDFYFELTLIICPFGPFLKIMTSSLESSDSLSSEELSELEDESSDSLESFFLASYSSTLIVPPVFRSLVEICRCFKCSSASLSEICYSKLTYGHSEEIWHITSS